MTIIQLDDELGIQTKYDPDFVEIIRKVPGRRWVKPYWVFPIRHAIAAAQIIQPFDHYMAKEITTHRAVAKWNADEAARLNIDSFDTSALASEFPDLMPHQLQAIEFGRLNKGRFLLCDAPGMGKSAAVLSFIEKHRQGMQTLIICPAITKFNWSNEVRRWTDKDPVVHSKSKATKLKTETSPVIRSADYFITTYDSFARIKEPPTIFQNIILDEIHSIKQVKTQRAKAVIRFAERSNLKSIIGMSGTLLRNRPAEMFTGLHLVKPSEFPSFYKYAIRYCDGKDAQFGFTSSGATNMDELNQVLRSCMLRRTDDILDLPPLTINYEWWNPPQMLLDDTKKMYYQVYFDTSDVLPTITRWREDIGTEKAIHLADSLITDTPVVIFYHHKATEENFAPNHEKIDGSTTDVERANIINRFQQGKIPVLLVSTTAAGQGINLTAATNVVLLERQYTPADEKQAIDRVHRIGQTRPVTVTIINARGTVDEAIHNLLERKQAIFDNVLDGISTESISHENIMQEMKNICLNSAPAAK